MAMAIATCIWKIHKNYTVIAMTEPAKTGLICTSNFMALKTHNSLCGQAIGIQI